MSKRYAFLVHTDRCIGCNACEIACKNYYQQEASVHWRKVYYMQEKDLPSPAASASRSPAITVMLPPA